MVLALSTLGGCKEGAKPQARTEATATGEAPAGVTISAARLVLPAVRNNPGAAYFTVTNNSSGTKAISAISINGAAKTEMHQTVGIEMNSVDRVDIAPGTSIAFEPGKFHVMAFDLDSGLRPGGQTTLTVQFADGGKAQSSMTVEAAGAAADAGAMHDMGAMH
ncbi:MAG: copper chaperone PCu(A)C [Sphingomonadales bacterium]|nr:copper chaperone PCu(A)C [Sphingomonadales bacterium]